MHLTKPPHCFVIERRFLKMRERSRPAHISNWIFKLYLIFKSGYKIQILNHVTLKGPELFVLRHSASPPHWTIKPVLRLTSAPTLWMQLCFTLTHPESLFHSKVRILVPPLGLLQPVSSSLVNCIPMLSDTWLLGNNVLLRNSAFFSFSHLHFIWVKESFLQVTGNKTNTF